MIKIKHLKYYEIDKSKWDNIVSCSDFSLPYFFSWYLDVVSPGWEALIAEDYSYIMPLTVKIKCGIKYVIQPPFTQQLGVISLSKNIDSQIINSFIKSIPYLIYDVNLNYNNFSKESKINLIIDAENYALVSCAYNKNTKRNIAKAINSDLKIRKIDLSQFVNLLNSTECKIKQNKSLLIDLLNVLYEKNSLYVRGIFKDEMLIAGVAAIESLDRMIYLIPISTNDGKKYSAMFLLLDDLIKYSMDMGYAFDFEGSMIPSVQNFYKGFGGKEQLYYRAHRLRNNKLFEYLHKIF